MDTKANVLLWIESICVVPEGQRLQAVSIKDTALGGESRAKKFSGSLRALSEFSTVEFEGSISIHHVMREGFVPYLTGATVKEVPCLLTDSLNVRLLFRGFVRVTSVNMDESIGPMIPDRIPLISNEWFGVARRVDDKVELTAFGDQEEIEISGSRAYCPWWGDSLGDADTPVFSVVPTIEIKGEQA